MSTEQTGDTYSETETIARREAALKVMLASPHRPHKDTKKGSSRTQSK